MNLRNLKIFLKWVNRLILNFRQFSPSWWSCPVWSSHPVSANLIIFFKLFCLIITYIYHNDNFPCVAVALFFNPDMQLDRLIFLQSYKINLGQKTCHLWLLNTIHQIPLIGWCLRKEFVLKGALPTPTSPTIAVPL